MSYNLHRIRGLLIGATVLAVDDPDKGVDESFFKITAKKDSKTFEFHLNGTDMGWWISNEKTILVGPSGKPLPVYSNAKDMLEDMTTHMGRQERASNYISFNEGESLFEECSDPRVPAIGFRCKATDNTWKLSLRAAKEYGNPLLLTPQGRNKFAKFITENWRAPDPNEVTP